METNEQQEKKNPLAVLEDVRKDHKKVRESWTRKLKTSAQAMHKIQDIAEVQIDLLSYRAQLVESNHELLAKISKFNKELKKQKADKLRHYSTKVQFKYQMGEKTTLFEGDTADLLEIIEVLNNQIKFHDQTVQTIDHFLYGIKSRIALEEFRRK
jgi:uncharacterized protein YqgV (UPF0045/DUF77 family)